VDVITRARDNNNASGLLSDISSLERSVTQVQEMLTIINNYVDEVIVSHQYHFLKSKIKLIDANAMWKH